MQVLESRGMLPERLFLQSDRRLYDIVYDNNIPFFQQTLEKILGQEVTIRYVPGNKILRQFPPFTLWLWETPTPAVFWIFYDIWHPKNGFIISV